VTARSRQRRLGNVPDVNPLESDIGQMGDRELRS
jgi:hypothetical protein